MEAGDGFELENVNGALKINPKETGLGSNMNKENEAGDNTGCDAAQANGDLKDPAENEEIDSSRAGEKKSAAVSGGKVSHLSKNMNSVKNRSRRNSEAVIPRNQKVTLSKSISYPAKVASPTNLRKSTTFVKQRKTDGKNSGQNGSEVVAAVANGGPPAKQINLAALPSIRRSLSTSVDATANGTSFSARYMSNDGMKKLPRDSLPLKNEDDANSTTSSTSSRTLSLRKSSGSGFAFRLDERAEKRKEFFMKLEEKTHAKEMETTDLQAKSKENQEAEIRQLRKSLTFKATPMPSFYQESSPPKLELKKIPPTRARSPKLGRQKPSSPAAENSSEGKISCRNSRSVLDPNKSNGGGANGDMDQVAWKKPTPRVLSKLPSRKTIASKPEEKSTGSKLKSLNSKKKSDKASAGNDSQQDSPPETVARIEIDSLKNPTEGCEIGPGVEINSLESMNLGDATILDLSDPEIAPNEVLVEG